MAKRTSGPEHFRQMAPGEQKSEEGLTYLSKEVNVAEAKSTQGTMAAENRG